MDYEYRIQLAEKELAHYREMQTILRSHQDAHDRSIEGLKTIQQRTEANLEKLSVAQLVTEARLESLGKALEAFIAALAREHSNGHPR